MLFFEFITNETLIIFPLPFAFSRVPLNDWDKWRWFKWKLFRRYVTRFRKYNYFNTFKAAPPPQPQAIGAPEKRTTALNFPYHICIWGDPNPSADILCKWSPIGLSSNPVKRAPQPQVKESRPICLLFAISQLTPYRGWSFRCVTSEQGRVGACDCHHSDICRFSFTPKEVRPREISPRVSVVRLS